MAATEQDVAQAWIKQANANGTFMVKELGHWSPPLPEAALEREGKKLWDHAGMMAYAKAVFLDAKEVMEHVHAPKKAEFPMRPYPFFTDISLVEEGRAYWDVEAVMKYGAKLYTQVIEELREQFGRNV